MWGCLRWWRSLFEYLWNMFSCSENSLNCNSPRLCLSTSPVPASRKSWSAFRLSMLPFDRVNTSTKWTPDIDSKKDGTEKTWCQKMEPRSTRGWSKWRLSNLKPWSLWLREGLMSTTVPPVLLPHADRMEPGLCHCHDTGFTVAWWEGFACRKKRLINVFNTGLRSDHKWSLKLVSKSVSYVHLERAIAVQKGNSQKLAHVALFTSCHPVLPANLMIESTPCHQHAKKFSYSLIL